MPPKMTLEEKVLSGIGPIESDSECWPWQKARQHQGYGIQNHEGATLAHRVAWTFLVGPIPEEMTLDHLCRNKACVNPDHLEVVTAVENTRRALPHKWENYREDLQGRAICANGHEQTPETQRVAMSGGTLRRSCRPCQAASTRRYLAKKKARTTA